MSFRRGAALTPIEVIVQRRRVSDLENAMRQIRSEAWRAEEGLTSPDEAISRMTAVALKALGDVR